MAAKETTRTTSQRQFEITKKEFAAALKPILGVEIPDSASGILVKEQGNSVVVCWTEHSLVEPPKPATTTTPKPESK